MPNTENIPYPIIKSEDSILIQFTCVNVTIKTLIFLKKWISLPGYKEHSSTKNWKFPACNVHYGSVVINSCS